MVPPQLLKIMQAGNGRAYLALLLGHTGFASKTVDSVTQLL
jgi:hypothetical protein